MKNNLMNNEIIKTGIRLLIITLAASVALALVNFITEPMIADVDRHHLEDVMLETLPGLSNPDFGDEVFTDERTGVTSYVSAYRRNGDLFGHVFFVTRKGDQGAISVVVGMSADGKILGVSIASHHETPGLGAKCASQDFLSQYVGKTGEFTVIKSGRAGALDIVAVTAATHTSDAVTLAVNDAVKFYNSALRNGGGDR